MVIADRPLDEIVPLQLAEDRSGAGGNGNGKVNGRAERSYKIVTQYSMGPIEEIGLLKMDFLGLRNLDVIEDAVEIIQRSRGTEIDMEEIPLDDAKTYEMLSRGDSVGVFQIESDGMREALKQIRPTEFNDIVAIDALYRPGAMRYIPDYARGKRDPSSVRYPDDRLRPITEETYGCCIYQEQLMEISKQIGGFSPAEADDLRKAVGKKKRDLMATMKDKFLEGCKASGTQRKVADDLWSLMTAAADYSFNKSHAACYALISYRTAYLKANFPAEYMAAVISSVMSTKDKVPFFVNRCEEMEIEVLPPDVNSSDHGFVVSGKSIRFGLDAVKNVGHAAVEAILSARERGGPFESIWDFCERVDARAVNKRAVECLIKCGALDSTEDPVAGCSRSWRRRSRARRRLRRTLAAARRRSSTSATPGSRRSPTTGPPASARPSRARSSTSASSCASRRRPWARSSRRIRSPRSATPCASGSTAPRRRGGKEDGAWVTVGGIVSEAKKVRTRSGAYVMFATLDDLEGRVELFVRDAAGETAGQIELDRVILVRGRVDHKGRGEMSLVVAEAEPFEPGEDELAAARAKARARDPDRIVLRVDAAEFGPQLLEDLKSLFETFPGKCEVLLEMQTREGTRRLRFGSDYCVDALACPPRRARPAARPESIGRLTDSLSALSRLSAMPRHSSPREQRTASGECRQCRTFCDRLVEPRGCLEHRCPYLYSYVDPLSGGHYMGCMRKVFRAEIDIEPCSRLPSAAGGFGGIKMTGDPLPQCQFRVEPAYEGGGPQHECVNPRFFDAGEPEPASTCATLSPSPPMANGESPSQQIDARIEELGDWRGETLARVRGIIREADPDVVEEWKWAKATSPGTPVWSHDGIICTGETYKSAVKMTFAKGASLEDPSGLFNASLEGNMRRAIDIHEGEEIDEEALKVLIRAAVALNTA